MNCQIHPFKQCSFYNKKEDKLQCPLCLLPTELQQQVIENTTKPLCQNSIIDIDLIESLAQSLIQDDDCHSDLNKLESHCFNLLQEFQQQVRNYLEQLCQTIQDTILQQLYKLRIQAEQQQTENEDNQKLLKNIQEMRKSDQNSCIESITSLQSSLVKCDKITHQKIQQLQMKITQSLEEYMKSFLKSLVSVDSNSLNKNLISIFESKEKQIQKTNEGKSVNSSMASQSGNISVEQIKKITIQHQHQSEFQTSSILISEGQIVVGTKCGKILLYDFTSFSEINRVEQAHKDSVKILQRGKNDFIFVSSGIDRFIKIWEKIFSKETNTNIISLKFDLEQQVSMPLCMTICEGIKINNQKEQNLLLVGSADNTVRIWNFENGQYLFTYQGHQGDVNCVAFVRKLNFVASGSQDKTIRLWDGINYKYSRHLFKFTGHTDSVLGLVSVSEENQILSGGLDKTLRLWDCEKKTQIKVITTQFMIYKLIFFQPGVVVSQSSDCRIRLYDYRINTMLHEINNQRKNVSNLCVDYENKSIQAINDNHINLFF